MSDDQPTRDFDAAAEVAVVGAVMRSRGRVLDDLALTGAQFGDPMVGAAYDRAADLYREHGFVDFVSFGASLEANPIKGVAAHHLIDAERNTPTVATAGYYARIVHAWSVKRALRQAGEWIVAHADAATDVDALADQARARIDAAASGTVADVVTIGESIYDTVADLEKPDVYTTTPWPELDHLIGGLRPGALYVIGARPGKGKSIVGSMLALSTARHHKWAAVSSLEMSRHEIHRRWIAQSGRVSMSALENRKLSRADWEAVTEVSAALAGLPIAVDDRGLTVWDIRHHARSVARKGPLGMVLVDYLQLMNPAKSSARRSRQEEVSEISRAMKQMAQDLEVPVVCLSQLNRESEARTGGRPRLSDLRESGAVEQDADVVMLLHRDEEKSPDVLSVAVAKNRHGACGVADLEWQGHYARAVARQWCPSDAIGRAS